MLRRLQCASSPLRIPKKIPWSRSRKSDRIPGLPKTSPCAASFSTWRPVRCEKCGKLHTRLLTERIECLRDLRLPSVPLQTASHLAHEVRGLSRASLPSNMAELARYLIGKTLVRYSWLVYCVNTDG